MAERKESRPKKPLMTRLRTRVRDYMLRGLLVIVPLGVTAYVLYFCYSITAGYLVPIIQEYFFLVPDYAVVPLSVALFLALLYVVGVVAAAVVGRRLIALAEAVIRHIPLVKTVYGASKQVVDVLSTQSADAEYQAAVVVDFPSPGLKSLGFVTGTIMVEDDREYYKIFIPTTPNPTSGYFELVPPEGVTPSSFSVEDAVKTVISAGILAPETLDFHIHARVRTGDEKDLRSKI